MKSRIDQLINDLHDEDIKNQDFNKITEFLYISFILKTLRLFTIIASISYFAAMLFKIILELEEDIFGEITLTECGKAVGYFKACYNLYGMS